MMNTIKTLVCPKCGYKITRLSQEVDNDEKCILCDTTLTEIKDHAIDETEKQKVLEEIIYQDSISKIYEQIELLGNDRVWDFIDNIINPFTRIAYRKLFFKANGIVPESEVTI